MAPTPRPDEPEESDVEYEEIPRTPSPDPLYLHSYLPTHIAATSAHLYRPLPSAPHLKAFPLSREETRGIISAKEDGALGHTFFPPSTYWSPSEKAVFFRALASHSRLRPDLIAERIHTKTTAEVEAYISLLDSALDSTPDEDLLPRANFPLAHEAPEQLIEYEDSQAMACEYHEEEYSEAMVWETRREEEREWRKENGIGAKSGRPRKGTGRETAKEKRNRGVEATHRADIAEWRIERQPFWEAEDALRSMDIVELGALDRLIKRDERQGPLDDIEAEDGVIVPDLLPGQRATSDPRGSVQAEAGPSNENAEAGHSRLTTPAPTSTTAPAADDEDDPANLSPVSRERLRKRLWMRRKRAAAKGEVANLSRKLFKPGRKANAAKGAAKTKGKGKGKADAGANEEEIDEDEEEEDIATRVASKRKRKANASSSEEDGEQDDDDKEEDSEEDQEAGAALSKKRTWQERRARGHLSGRTKPYKFEHDLRAVGLDGTGLRERGLGGLLNYGGLGKLSRIYASLDTSTASDPPHKISGDFLRYLESLVRIYARRAIGMAIRVRELDFALKGHTKVWRLGKRRMVLKHHVARSLALVGPPRTSKKAYFTALASRMCDTSDDSGELKVTDGEEADEEDEDDADEESVHEEEDGEGDEEYEEEVDRKEKADEEDEGEEGKGTAKSGAGWINRNGQLVSPFWPPRAFVAPYISTSHLSSIPTTYPFGIDAPSTRPRLAPSEHADRAAREAEAEEDLMESDAVELARELKEEERLNGMDEKKAEREGIRVMVVLGLIAAPEPAATKRGRSRKRPAREVPEGSDGEDADSRPRKRFRRQGGAMALQSAMLAAAEPDGVRVKSAAYVVDSDEDM
ncbi:hypothetical protein PENSPDRAFT_181357 [Peniophora sp. CONT]|nr:hypothetical protein PENSPDRAFT_181357 [Peniophora sp. CONT]